jgi:23S rRNA pseudouridine2605 synthase
MEERLQKILSRAGIASRRGAEEVMAHGRVTVNGKTVTELGTKADLEHDDVRVDGVRVRPPQAPVYLMLNKPKGVVTTRRDPEGRPTAYELVRDAGPHLQAIGRLDLASSGLLLFTTDTRLAAALLDPANAVPRVYVVTVRGPVDDASLETLSRGLAIDGALVTPRVTLRKRSGRETHLLVELVEGRNREIRRLFAAVGHEVTRLWRVAFGGVELGTLPAGRWRELDAVEIASLVRVAAAGCR